MLTTNAGTPLYPPEGQKEPERSPSDEQKRSLQIGCWARRAKTSASPPTIATISLIIIIPLCSPPAPRASAKCCTLFLRARHNLSHTLCQTFRNLPRYPRRDKGCKNRAELCTRQHPSATNIPRPDDRVIIQSVLNKHGNFWLLLAARDVPILCDLIDQVLSLKFFHRVFHFNIF